MKHTHTQSRRGFSLVEVLIVVVIIGLLVGIAAPAFMAVRNNARRTQAESQLQSMSSAIDQFRTDYGYLPPLILDHPSVLPTTPDWCTSLTARDDARDRLAQERYHSLYSLSLYLLGVGELSPDASATNPDRHDGFAGPGFRDPGPDRAWGGARMRTVATHRVAASGDPTEPYVGFADSELVRRASADLGDFPEDDNVGQDSANSPWRRMFVILDPWGTPVRYYRAWPTRVAGTDGQSLLDVPAELVDAEALKSGVLNTASFDATLDMELARGEYALLSAGRDRAFAPKSFAKQTDPPRGSVRDFLQQDEQARSRALREGLADNLRLVR